MEIEVKEAPLDQAAAVLAEYACIPIAFTVQEVLDLTLQGELSNFVWTSRRLDSPYVKDYDAIVGEGPLHWMQHFDISHWGLLVARSRGLLVGGAAIAFGNPHLLMLEGRTDLAVLWDIRVCPEVRKHGVGSALFRSAEVWAIARGCRQLKVETQNINVPACRFYARQGCELGAIHRFAYPDFPNEVQLLWYKTLLRIPPSFPYPLSGEVL